MTRQSRLDIRRCSGHLNVLELELMLIILPYRLSDGPVIGEIGER